MKSFQIRLDDIHSARDLCGILSRYGFDAFLTSGRDTVDARSLLGIFSLDLKKDLELTVDTEELYDLPEKLFPYII